ncbi:MAG: hypothetical protein WCV73_04515 [Patescibacteria group bacterium]|jgi:hypothetical protein
MNTRWAKYYLAVLVGICYVLCMVVLVTNLFWGVDYELPGIIALGAFTLFFSILFVMND